MADVPISYFKAVRSSGKFQPSNPPDLETPPPVINPPGSGGGVNLFKSLGDVTDRSFLGKNGYVPVVTAENLLSLQPLPQVPDNGLISGGIVQWTGTGYIFNVSSCFYRISGEPYSTDPTQKTLSTPDVTNNRIDVFAVDINSLVVVIEGTPSATPVKPQIDPSTQLELTSVIVTASSTEPTLTEEIIYDENIEWAGTSAGTGTVSFNSAVDPFEGTVSIETTDIQNGFIVKLTNSIDVDISTFQTLGFQLNLKASMPSNQNLYGLFINSVGDAVSNKFLLNFDKSLAGSYQFIGIALNTLSFTSNDIRAIYFSFERLAGSPTYSGFFLDVVRLEGGINPPLNVGAFIKLIDAPNTYSGQAGKSVTVKADESGLEFSTGGGGGADADAVHYNAPDGKTTSERAQARSNIWSTSMLSQDVATSGTISDLSKTSNYIAFTAGSAVTLNGIAGGLDGEEVVLQNFTGVDMILPSLVGTAANRFYGKQIIPDRGIGTIKYNTLENVWQHSGGQWTNQLNGAGVFTKNLIGIGVEAQANISLKIAATGNTASTYSMRAESLAGTVIMELTGVSAIFPENAAFGSTTAASNVRLIARAQTSGGTRYPFALQNAAGAYVLGTSVLGDITMAATLGVGVGATFTSSPARLTVRGAGTTTGQTALFEDSAGTDNIKFIDNGQVQFLRLPTSSAGLVAGSLWNNSGVINIV